MVCLLSSSQVRSLAESHNCLELDKFSKARKSLIGYEVSSLTIYVSEIIEQCAQLGTDTCKVNPYAGNLTLHKTTMATATERPKTQ